MKRITAPLCEGCWQRRFPYRGRPIRVPANRRREATCASCYATTRSGIFVFQGELEQPITKENTTMTTKKKYLAKTIRRPDGTYQPFIGHYAWSCTYEGCRTKAEWIVVNEDRTRTAGGRCDRHADFDKMPRHPDECATRSKKADTFGDGEEYAVTDLSWVCTAESFPDENGLTTMCDTNATWFVLDENGRCTDEGLCERHKYKHPLAPKKQRKPTRLLSKTAIGRSAPVDETSWVCTMSDCPARTESPRHSADWYVVDNEGRITAAAEGACNAWCDAHPHEYEVYEDDKDLV